MKRILLWAALCLLLCTACYPRADLTSPEETDPTASAAPAKPTAPSDTAPEGEDEMAAYAWEVYERAMLKEKAYASYDLTFESREYVLGRSAVNRARILRRQGKDGLRLLIVKELDQRTDSGYYENGTGYFDIDGKKYRTHTNENGFFSEMGFSKSGTLSRDMFADAIVVPAEEGRLTVSCPLPEPYASAYAQEALGVRGSQVRRVEMGFTVDADGAPLEYLTTVTLWVSGYGEVTYESMNRYEQVGEGVTVDPPDGLDEYAVR